jgi:hypothetical protein
LLTDEMAAYRLFVIGDRHFARSEAGAANAAIVGGGQMGFCLISISRSRLCSAEHENVVPVQAYHRLG